MNYQVFVSASPDCKLAEPLFEKLLVRGYVATFGNGGVSDSKETYAQKIRGCKDVVFLLSARALAYADYPDDLFAYSCQQAVQNGCNIIVLVTEGVDVPFVLPSGLEALGAYGHPLSDGYLNGSNLEKSMTIICGLLSAKPVAPGVYTRHSRELVKLRLPLLNPYRPAAGYNPVLLKFHAFVERSVMGLQPFTYSDPGFPEFPEGFFEERNETYSRWYQANGWLLEAVRQKAAKLKGYVAESGTLDAYYYAAALFFAGGHLQQIPSWFKSTHPLACVSGFYYCVDWPATHGDELMACYGQETHEIFRRVIPMPFAAFKDMISYPGITPERRALIEKNTLMLFDFMMHLSALLTVTVKDPQYFVQVNQQIICYYAYLRKLGLYLPEEMQTFMAKYFK